jgi:predicted amidohydrolase
VFRCGGGDFAAAQQICIMRGDGTGIHHLTPERGFVAQSPVFSPDGRQIAFLAQRNSGQVILYTMGLSGSRRKNVYNLGPHQELGSLNIAWQPIP